MRRPCGSISTQSLSASRRSHSRTRRSCLLLSQDIWSSRSWIIIRFATRVGYFMEENETLLKHVYGVHYDYDDRNIAHPVFHSQMAPMTEFRERINVDYNRKFGETEDCVRRLLTNVRIPTAQMD